MKHTKVCLLIASLLLLLVLPMVMSGCGGDECTHPNLQLIEVPTKTCGGISACLDCHSSDSHVNLPALTDASFYSIEVIDADLSICTCEILGKTFTLYSTNFEIESGGIYDDDRMPTNNYYRITGYYGTSEIVNIPTEYNDGYNGVAPVTVINSFAENKSVKEVNITSNIKTISPIAFQNCTALENVVIPNTVTSIGWEIFRGCTSLKSLTLPQIGATDELGYSDDLADLFNDDNGDASNVPASLKTVTITGNITEVNSFAFNKCQYIETINLPASVTKIDEYAFQECKSLKSLNLSAALTEIGDRAFAECTSLQGIFYSGTKEQWKAIAIHESNQEIVASLKVLYYAEQEPTVIEFLMADRALWHYNEQNEPVIWAVAADETNTLDGKKYYHYSVTVTVSDEYWNALKQAEAQGMIDEVFASAEEKQLYLGSISKEDYQAKLTVYTQDLHKGMEITFAEGKYTLSQNGQTAYPVEYVELNGAIVFNPNTEEIVYTIEDGKVCQDSSNEFLSVKHVYLPYA